MSRSHARSDHVELTVVMIDGLELAGMTHVIALGIAPDGKEEPSVGMT